MTEQKKTNAVQLLKKYEPQLMPVVPDHMKGEKLMRVIASQINQNPELGLCDPHSLLAGVMRCATLGLMPGSVQSMIHLIPFNNRKKNIKECQVIIGYQGLIELARRSGQIKEIYAETVHENDKFEVFYGLNRNLIHQPARTNRGALTDVYAVAHFKEGGYHFEVMSKDEIEKIRNRPKYPNPIWNTDYEEMAKKTAIRRLSKYLPLQTERDGDQRFAEATNLQAMVEAGNSQENEDILITAGVDVPEHDTKAQAFSTDDLKDKALNFLTSIPDNVLEKHLRTSKKDEILAKMDNEKNAKNVLDVLGAIANKMEKA